jgi:hypothetical protein
MMWARSTGTLFFLAGGMIGAQSANDGVAELESCFQVARIADTICSKLPNDRALQLDCFQKTRAAELECLEHVLSEAHAAPPVPQESSGSQLGPPVAAQEIRSEDASIKQTGDAGSTTAPTESSPLRDSNGPPTATAKTNPSGQPGSSPPADAAALERSSTDASIKQIGATRPPAASTENSQFQESDSPPKIAAGTQGQTGSSSATIAAVPSGDAPKQADPASSPAMSADSSPFQQSDSPPKSTFTTNQQPAPSPATDATIAAGSSKEVLPEHIGDTQSPAAPGASHPPQDSNAAPKASSRTSLPQRPEANEAKIDAISPAAPLKPIVQSTRPIGGDWVVSETTSPIDYSPLVTALIRATSQVRDAPNTLTIRCRAQRTELVVHTDGVWRTPRGSEMQGAYQINDQPAVSQRWVLSPDRKSATYKDNVVGLLQALPDGARFKINIADQTSPSHEATFRLDSWDAVRRKIGRACQWSLTADQGLPQRR